PFLQKYTKTQFRSQTVSKEPLDIKSILLNSDHPITLSEAIVLGALNEKYVGYQPVSTFRQNQIVQLYKEKLFHASNWKAQVRTELNQDRRVDKDGSVHDGSRFAGRAFKAIRKDDRNNLYKLKDPSEMDEKTRQDFTKIYNLFKSKTIQQKKIPLHNFPTPLKIDETQKNYDDQGKAENYYFDDQYYVPDSISIPENIFVIGTVNVDETTYTFSPKVLDRSNVIEFNSVDLFHAYGYGQSKSEMTDFSDKTKAVLNLKISLATSKDTREFIKTYPSQFETLIQIFHILSKFNRQFGYRVFNEISLFVMNYCGNNRDNQNADDGLDMQINQKILPKVNGSADDVQELLEQIREVVHEHNYYRSESKISRMLNSLETTGYVTYIE
ncbi:hypothetical protein, partial [Lentilactobacillus rapi]|uniref:hypothetical protein n=2 Tax=Lentilactobacillus rapi TaxID=481723 RepID=UPI000704D23B